MLLRENHGSLKVTAARLSFLLRFMEWQKLLVSV